MAHIPGNAVTSSYSGNPLIQVNSYAWGGVSNPKMKVKYAGDASTTALNVDIIDPGAVTVNLDFDADNPTHQLLYTNCKSGAAAAFVLTLKVGKTYTGNVFVESMDWGDLQPGSVGKVTAVFVWVTAPVQS